MELRHLRYFKAVAETLHFSRAADQLRVAQPALSRQIRALEDELGARLLDRNRVQVRLTDAGRTFYGHICQVLAQVELAAASVRDPARGDAGELIICNDWRVAGQFVPATLTEFNALHPRAEVVLRDMKMHDQFVQLRARKAHVGFAIRHFIPARNTALQSLVVLKSRIFVVLAKDHSLSTHQAVKLADLARETWILFDEKEAPGFRATVTQLCKGAGFTPRFGKAASTPEGVFGRVASGYGVALATEHGLPHQSTLVRALPTDCEPVELCAVWSRREKSPLLQHYLAILRRHVAQAKAPGAGEPSAA